MFAWTYSKIPRLDPAISMHRLAIELDRRPVKQVPKRMHLDLAAKVEAEVNKLITVKFILEVQYPVASQCCARYASTSGVLTRPVPKTTSNLPHGVAYRRDNRV